MIQINSDHPFQLQCKQKDPINSSDHLIRYELEEYKKLYEEQRVKLNKLSAINQGLILMKKQDKQQINKQSMHKQFYNYMKDRQKDKLYWENQIDRHKKKLQLAEKTRQILQDQINVLRSYIVDKNTKIQQLCNQIDSYSQPKIQSNPQNQPFYQITKNNQVFQKKIKTLMTEYQQEKQLLRLQLNQVNESYRNSCEAYKINQQKLQAQKELSCKKIQTLQIQLQYYIKKQQQAIKQIEELRNKNLQCQLREKNNFQQANKKWWGINSKLLQKIQELEQTIKKLDQQLQKQKTQVLREKIKIQEIKTEKQDLTKQLSWYLQLIQQTKGHYIHSELQKENLVKKLKAEKNQIAKTHKNSSHNNSVCTQSNSRITVYRLSVQAQKTPNKIDGKQKNSKFTKSSLMKSELNE